MTTVESECIMIVQTIILQGNEGNKITLISDIGRIHYTVATRHGTHSGSFDKPACYHYVNKLYVWAYGGGDVKMGCLESIKRAVFLMI
jgi:hypothetical protein